MLNSSFFIKVFYFILCYRCISVRGYVDASSNFQEGEKRVLDPLEMEQQVVVSHLTWVLGTKLKPSPRQASALNC